MSNLLPLSAQRRAWGATRSRMVLAAASVCAAACIISIVALVPAILVYRTALAGIAPDPGISEARSAAVPDIAQVQALVPQIAPYASIASSTEAIRAALAARPNGITINRIAYAGGSAPSISISGSASTAEALDAYRTALTASGRFASVSLPIGALIGSGDHSFTITLSGSF